MDYGIDKFLRIIKGRRSNSSALSPVYSALFAVVPRLLICKCLVAVPMSFVIGTLTSRLVAMGAFLS